MDEEKNSAETIPPTMPDTISVSIEKQLISRGTANEPARTDLSLFDYVCPEVRVQMDKAIILTDMGMNVGFSILGRIMSRLKREEKEGLDSPASTDPKKAHRGQNIVCGDAFKAICVARMAFDLANELEKKYSDQNRQGLSKIYEDHKELGRRAIADAKAIQKGILSKTGKDVVKEVTRRGYAVQAAETV